MIPLSRPATCRWLAAILILAFGGLHWAYLTLDCPLDLAPDEAHYWDWSRQLDWSYYSKGPLVAWLIRASCSVLGESMPAVRLPAVLCGMLLLTSLYILTVQVFGRDWLGLLVVLAALTLPPVWAVSLLMTIDAPYTCLWGWALVLGHRAVFRGSAWAWTLLGLVIGLGILAKYTMVLFLPSLFLFLLAGPEQRAWLRRPQPWLMMALAGLICLPILIWNCQNDWVSFRHVHALAGLEPRQTFQPLGPLTYVGQQFALLLGAWFVVWVLAMWASRPWREDDAGKRYLWWLSAPVFGVFLLFSIKTGGGEINWPVTAYLSGLVLAAGWLTEQLASVGAVRRCLMLGGVAATCLLGLGITALMHFSERVYPLLASLAGPPTPARPYPLRRLDPTCRLRGWQTLALQVDQLRRELRADGDDPVLAGSNWWLPGQVAFYCQDQPTVYGFGTLAGCRTSQYDLWRPNPVGDPAVFQGRTFILVGEVPPTLRAAFEYVDVLPLVQHHVRGQPVAAWQISIGRGFRGSVATGISQW
jgi:4-amino-4-deoxy-L-arabinose transferase-like glycosyltransferase